MGSELEYSCAGTCELYTKCVNLKIGEDQTKRTEQFSDMWLLENSLYIREGDDPKLKALFEKMIERMETRFAGDPQGLSEALKASGDLYGLILDGQEEQRRSFNEALQRSNKSSMHETRRMSAANAFLQAMDEHGCNGPKKRGRLGLSPIETCSSTASEETKRQVRSAKQADDMFLKNYRAGMPSAENFQRLYDGEYDI